MDWALPVNFFLGGPDRLEGNFPLPFPGPVPFRPIVLFLQGPVLLIQGLASNLFLAGQLALVCPFLLQW